MVQHVRVRGRLCCGMRLLRLDARLAGQAAAAAHIAHRMHQDTGATSRPVGATQARLVSWRMQPHMRQARVDHKSTPDHVLWQVDDGRWSAPLFFQVCNGTWRLGYVLRPYAMALLRHVPRLLSEGARDRDHAFSSSRLECTCCRRQQAKSGSGPLCCRVGSVHRRQQTTTSGA